MHNIAIPIELNPIPMDFPQIRDLIADDLNHATDLIYKHLNSTVPVIQEIGNYIIESGGKRSRAVLALLSAKICELNRDKACLFAAIIEMIHAATLLHDDVIDASTLRRGKPTANMVYSNSASVLSGDFLYSRTFEMMVDLESMSVLHELASASNKIAEGEMMQLQNCHKFDLTEEDYLKVIERKTAVLFAVAAKIPAVLNQQSAMIQNALHEYGRLMGIAFQLVDDVLDYTSDRSMMGKNQGDDLAEGKMTLPLIYAKALASPEDVNLINDTILHGDQSKFPEILAIIQKTKSATPVLQRAEEFVNLAKAQLAVLPKNSYTEALHHFADLAVARKA